MTTRSASDAPPGGLSLDAEVDGIAPWRKKKFEAEQAMQAQLKEPPQA